MKLSIKIDRSFSAPFLYVNLKELPITLSIYLKGHKIKC